MEDMIQQYEQSARAIYERIQTLEATLPGTKRSVKYDIEARIRKLRAMHLELGHDIRDMRERAPHV